MSFNIGSLTKIFGITGSSISSEVAHTEALSHGNAMGLRPETGDISGHYQQYLRDFEHFHDGMIDPPDDLDPDMVTAAQYQAAEAKRLGELKAQYRAAMHDLMGEATANYQAIVTQQTFAETQADAVQGKNITYLDGHVSRTFGQASREAEFAGSMAAMRQSINRTQRFISFN